VSVETDLSSEKVLVISFDIVKSFHSHLMESLTLFLNTRYTVGFLCKKRQTIAQEALRSSPDIDFFEYSSPNTEESEQITINKNRHSSLDIISKIRLLTEQSTADRLSHPHLVDYIKFSNYSLIIYNSMDYGMPALCHFLNIPCIQVISSGLGGVQNPLSLELMDQVPYTLAGFIDLNGLMKRLINTMLYVCDHMLRMYYFYPGIEHIVRRHQLIHHQETQSYWQISANTPKSTLIYSNSAIDCEIPIHKSYVRIGGAMLSNNRLSQEYQDVMDRSSSGIIVVAFGRGSLELSDSFLQLLVETFSKLNHTIIWSVGSRASAITNVSANLIVRKSIPQNALLAHPNCKLFVTHAGLGSTVEAIYNAVPVIAIPIQADQNTNAYQMTHNFQMGTYLNFHDLSHRTLQNAVSHVLTNQNYSKSAQTASLKLRACDSKTADERILEAIEEAIPSGNGVGNSKLKVSDRTQHWIKIIPTDILVLISIIIFIVVVFLSLIVKGYKRSLASLSLTALFHQSNQRKKHA